MNSKAPRVHAALSVAGALWLKTAYTVTTFWPDGIDSPQTQLLFFLTKQGAFLILRRHLGGLLLVVRLETIVMQPIDQAEYLGT